MLERYVRNIPEIAYQLAEVADKPLTIIYPNGRSLAPGVIGSDGSVGIRICFDGFCNELITSSENL
jgi:L-threonylcarbamoyladenylate synthase